MMLRALGVVPADHSACLAVINLPG